MKEGRWKSSLTWEENNKMYTCIYLHEVDCEGMDWIMVAQNRDRLWALFNGVMKLRVP